MKMIQKNVEFRKNLVNNANIYLFFLFLDNDAIKFLNNLNSKNVSVIRKRQIMHNLFGDYRKKMINEDKLGQTKIAFKENEKLDTIVNSKFLRKSTTKLINKKDINSLKDLNENMNDLEINVEKEENEHEKENYFKMPTGNSNFSFNFKFDQENEEK